MPVQFRYVNGTCTHVNMGGASCIVTVLTQQGESVDLHVKGNNHRKMVAWYGPESGWRGKFFSLQVSNKDEIIGFN